MKKLTAENQWQALEWRLDGVKVDPAKEAARVIVNGVEVEVEWREGHKEVSDHGHTYKQSRMEGFIAYPGTPEIWGRTTSLEALLRKGAVVHVLE